MSNKEKKVYTGFVAQEVEAAANKLGYDFSGVHKPENNKDLYGLSYSEFVMPLVKSVQQLSKMNDEKDIKIDALQKQIDELKAIVLSGTTSLLSQQHLESNTKSTIGFLKQNVPNPFTNSTTINYYLSVNNGNVYINFYNTTGILVKSVKLNGNGSGTIQLKTNELSSGTYQYALMIGNNIIDSKKMILAK